MGKLHTVTTHIGTSTKMTTCSCEIGETHEVVNPTDTFDMYVDFKTLKVGDRFVESEYGSTIFLTVITKPKLERPDYMVFKAKSDDGKIVDYGFSYPSGAYNPTIWNPKLYELTKGSDLVAAHKEPK